MNKSEQLGFNPNPTTVITDFEQAVLNAISTSLGPHVSSQGCFYHLTQSTWRKVHTPDGLEGLLDYFNATYVSGSFRRIQPPVLAGGEIPPVRVRRIPPLYPPRVWNVHDATMNDEPRTNNLCESWNFSFRSLIGHDHPTVWKAIESIRKDQAFAQTQLIHNSRGEPPRKRIKRATREHQQRLRNLCQDFIEGRKDMSELLHGVGHCIRLK